MKIWAKTYKNHKILKQYVYENTAKLVYSQFLDYLIDICYELDIPTPIILKPHLFNMAKFNFVKFLPRDFIEPIDFDYLILENIFV